MWQWVDAGFLSGIRGNAACPCLLAGCLLHQLIPAKHTQASKGVDTIDVHRTATADTLTATPSEGQGGVDFVLDSNERIQHHGAGLGQVQFVGLHLGLFGGSIGVPAVNLELLDLGSGLLNTS